MSNLEMVFALRGQRNVRLGTDASTGHGCFGPTVPASASMTVFTDQIAEVRVSDKYVPHCCPSKGCHSPMVIVGARITYTDQLATHRNGDPLSCGDMSSNGSFTTYSGN